MKDFKMEYYLQHVNDCMLRRSLSKLRLRSHRLVESGGHCKPKASVEDLTCYYGKAGRIEDETHILIECPFYLEEREHLLSTLVVKSNLHVS